MGFFRSLRKPRIGNPTTAIDVAFSPEPFAAPFGVTVQAKVKDAAGVQYVLPFGVRRTDRGWFNAELGTELGKGIEVVGWRRRDFGK